MAGKYDTNLSTDTGQYAIIILVWMCWIELTIMLVDTITHHIALTCEA